MKIDATLDQGVSQDDVSAAAPEQLDDTQDATNQAPDKPHDPRAEAMETIIAHSRTSGDDDDDADDGSDIDQDKADEEQSTGDDGEQDKDADEKTAPASAEQDTPQPTGVDNIFTIGGKAHLKTKVLGEDKYVPLDQVQTGLQKVASADRKFEEAAKLRREAEEVQNRNATDRTATAPQPDPAKADEPKPAKAELDYADLAERIQYGDKEDAAEALKALLEGVSKTESQSSQAFNPEELVNQAVELATQRTQADAAYKDNLKTFGDEFPDIVADQQLAQNAANEVHRVRAEDLLSIGYPQEQVGQMTLQDILQAHRHHQQDGTVQSEVDLFRAAGTRTRKWIDSLVTSHSQPNAADLSARRNEKRNMATPPAANMRSPAPAEPKPLSGSDVIADMRRQRGQA